MAVCVGARPRRRAQRRPLAEQAAVVLEVGVNPVRRSSFKPQRVDASNVSRYLRRAR